MTHSKPLAAYDGLIFWPADQGRLSYFCRSEQMVFVETLLFVHMIATLEEHAFAASVDWFGLMRKFEKPALAMFALQHAMKLEAAEIVGPSSLQPATGSQRD